MTYYESASDQIISKERAIQELINHGCLPQDIGDVACIENGDFHEFFNDLGERDFYTAQEVLNWLGY